VNQAGVKCFKVYISNIELIRQQFDLPYIGTIINGMPKLCYYVS